MHETCNQQTGLDQTDRVNELNDLKIDSGWINSAKLGIQFKK